MIVGPVSYTTFYIIASIARSWKGWFDLAIIIVVLSFALAWCLLSRHYTNASQNEDDKNASGKRRKLRLELRKLQETTDAKLTDKVVERLRRLEYTCEFINTTKACVFLGRKHLKESSASKARDAEEYGRVKDITNLTESISDMACLDIKRAWYELNKYVTFIPELPYEASIPMAEQQFSVQFKLRLKTLTTSAPKSITEYRADNAFSSFRGRSSIFSDPVLGDFLV